MFFDWIGLDMDGMERGRAETRKDDGESATDGRQTEVRMSGERRGATRMNRWKRAMLFLDWFLEIDGVSSTCGAIAAKLSHSTNKLDFAFNLFQTMQALLAYRC